MSDQSRAHVEQELLRLAKTFAGVPPAERSWQEFDAYILSLAEEGFSRGDIYVTVLAVLGHREQLTEESQDALGDYLTGLTGHCASECFVRLPGEPSDPLEFARYVRDGTWMKR